MNLFSNGHALAMLTAFGIFSNVPAFAFDPPASPICVLTNKVSDSIPSPEMRFAIAKKLGIKTIRTLAADVPFSIRNRARPYWGMVRASGLKTVQTFGNREEGSSTSHPPADLKAYALRLEDAIRFLKPTLVVIENEENVPKFYAGTADQYLAQLETAVAVAHRLGYPVTNGGMTVQVLAPVIAADYASKGRTDRARSFLTRIGKDHPILGKGWPAIQRLPRFRRLLAAGRTLVAGYKKSGIDYVNLHWYTSDPTTLREAVKYLETATGKKAVTHEFGTHASDPAVIKALLDEVTALKLPYACWYDGDGPIAYGLHDPDGSLRPGGLAFQAWMKAHP